MPDNSLGTTPGLPSMCSGLPSYVNIYSNITTTRGLQDYLRTASMSFF